jgi:uncharacterized membrane protein HdeD (DUF308 family)
VTSGQEQAALDLIYELMPKQRQLRRSYTRVMSILMIVIGLVLMVRTVAAGGGPASAGLLLGILFVLAGAARLYLQFRRR